MEREREIDLSLGISTGGMREWDRKNAENYNRTESTPYAALDLLYETLPFKKPSRLVDFGCGRGRVLFYTHHKTGIPVAGIELLGITFDELMRNRDNYLHATGSNYEEVYIEYGNVKNYEIKAEDNIFFFFNPFSTKVFQQVFQNIEKSLKEHPRKAYIILYYPLEGFVKYMRRRKSFVKKQIIDLKDVEDDYMKFIVYETK